MKNLKVLTWFSFVALTFALPVFAAIDLTAVSDLIIEFTTAVAAAIGVVLIGMVGYMAVVWGAKTLVRFVNGMLYNS